MLRKRWIRFALVGFLVAMLGASFVSRWMPHYRPGLKDGETYGVDVSRHQGEIDWKAVAGDDIDFAYIKATEGGDWIDPFFPSNWSRAQEAGLEVGAYHFFTLCTPGKIQAENFLATVPIEDATLPAALDLETGGNCSRRPDQAWVEEEVGIFLDLVEAATGREVLLYLLDNFDDLYDVSDSFTEELWTRRLFRRPSGDRWALWQFSNIAEVNGIDGGVDLNVGRTNSG